VIKYWPINYFITIIVIVYVHCTQYFCTLECTTDDQCPGGVCSLETCVGKLENM
jgi:hypothetical protein